MISSNMIGILQELFSRKTNQINRVKKGFILLQKKKPPDYSRRSSVAVLWCILVRELKKYYMLDIIAWMVSKIFIFFVLIDPLNSENSDLPLRNILLWLQSNWYHYIKSLIMLRCLCSDHFDDILKIDFELWFLQ